MHNLKKWQIINGKSSRRAFMQGIPRNVVVRLLNGAHGRDDRGYYYQCDWWKEKRLEALEAFHRQCALCGLGYNLEVHHKPKAYRRLFREQPLLELTVLCRRCHKHHHRK